MLNLTRQEVLVIQFLVGFFLLGTAVHLYRSCVLQPGSEQAQQARQEAVEFAETAQQIDSMQQGDLPLSKPQVSGAESRTPAGGKINLNTAQKDELIRLTGIGPTIAERIILYREDVQAFHKIEDLLKVKGIGKITLERIKDEVTIE